MDIRKFKMSKKKALKNIDSFQNPHENHQQ